MLHFRFPLVIKLITSFSLRHLQAASHLHFVFLFLYLLPLLLAYYFLHWDYHQVAIILLGHWITLVDIFILASKCRVIQDGLMMMTSLYVIFELRLILRFPLHFILLYFLWIQVSTFGWFEWFSYFAFRYTSYSFYQYCLFYWIVKKYIKNYILYFRW